MAKMTGRKVYISEETLTKNDFDPKFWSTARSMCQGIVDLRYKSQGAKNPGKGTSNKSMPASIQRLSHALEEQLTKV
jgi:hypothetical protein